MTNDFSEEGPFRQAVKAALMALLDQVDDIDSDEHDPSMTDGNLKVVFEDGSTFVLCLSSPPPVSSGCRPTSPPGTSSGAAASGWSETAASPCWRCCLACFPTNWGWTYSSPSGGSMSDTPILPDRYW